MPQLLNVDTALQHILDDIHTLSATKVALEDALTRVIAEDITAQADLPPFANSSMDGFAVIAEDTRGADSSNPVTLKVVMDILAGVMPTQTLQSGQAARIMTGAPIPDGATAVVPVEQTNIDWTNNGNLPDTVNIYQEITTQTNIRPRGENIRFGDVVARAGTLITPAIIGICAALGISEVPVIRQPRVVILTTGDELVDLDQSPEPGQIRDVNSYVLAALIRQHHGEAIRMPITRDDPNALRALFDQALALKPDMIISSAGVSVGAVDYVRSILEEMGVMNFWRINMRPGKPLVYGRIHNIPFLGLPGNPVSAMVTFDVLARPALLKLGGYEDDAIYRPAIVETPVKSDGRRTYARVTLSQRGTKLFAREINNQSSGALMSVVMADGLLIIPEDVTTVEAGTELTVKLLKPFN